MFGRKQKTDLEKALEKIVGDLKKLPANNGRKFYVNGYSIVERKWVEIPTGVFTFLLGSLRVPEETEICAVSERGNHLEIDSRDGFFTNVLTDGLRNYVHEKGMKIIPLQY